MNPDGTMIEIGSPWLPYNGSQINSPHGVSIDPNGNLYIAELGESNYVQLDCDGNITNMQAEARDGFNHIIIDNYMYMVAGDFVEVFNLCDGSTSLVGFILLGDTDETTSTSSWGITYNENDGLIYVTDNYPGSSAAQFASGDGDIYAIDPSDPEVAGSVWQLNSTINPIISGLDRLMGITFDANNNMYFVEQTAHQSNSTIHKYNYDGTNWTSVSNVSDNTNDLSGFYNAWGITWSSTSNSILVTSFYEDCVARIDAASMTYTGAAVPHVPGANAKALSIIEECCYNGASTINTTICEGDVVLLRDLLGCGICGGSWSRTSGTGGTYDACAQTFVADGSTTNSSFSFTSNNEQCGPSSLTVNISVGQPEAGTATPLTACQGGTIINLADQLAGEDSGGEWSADAANPSGGVFSPAGGTFDPATASVGTYNFTYSFAATDNCVADEATVMVTVNDCTCSLQLTTLTDKSICEGGTFPTASTTINVTNGVTVDYQWYNENGTNNPTTDAIVGQTTATLTALPTTIGSYTYRVQATSTLNNTCMANDTVTLVINANPTATAAVTDATCNGSTVNSDGTIILSGFNTGDSYDITPGATHTGELGNLVTNQGFETITGSTATFSTMFQGIRAEEVPKSSTVIPDWIADYSCSDPCPVSYWLFDENDEVNNPEGDYFVWFAGESYCVRQRIDLVQGECYQICASVAAFSDAPTQSTTTFAVELWGSGYNNNGSAVIPGEQIIPVSNSFTSLNWQEVCFEFIAPITGDPTAFFSQNKITTNTISDGMAIDNIRVISSQSTASAATTIPVGGVVASNLINPTGTEDYTVRIFNDDGCFVDRTVTLNETDCSCTNPVLTALTDKSICEGGTFPTASTTINVTNGVTVDYQWYNENGTNNPTTDAIVGQTTATLTALPTTIGSYIYRVQATSTLNNTCMANDTVTLVINANPTATAAVTDATCNGSTVNSDGTIILSGFNTGDSYDITPGATYMGELGNIVTNQGFETITGSAATFSTMFQGIRAEEVPKNSTVIPDWIADYSCSDPCPVSYWLFDENDEVNNPEGDYFVWFAGESYCVRQRIDLVQGECYQICASVAAFSDAPTQSTTTFAVELWGSGYNNNGSAVIPGEQIIPVSNSFTSLNWQEVCFEFIAPITGDPTAFFSQNKITTNTISDGMAIDNIRVISSQSTASAATTIPVGGVVASNLINPTGTEDYTVRIFNDDGCFVDRTVTLNETTCAPTYSLGNQVFTDTDNSGDLNGAEIGIDGVQLQLLNANGTVYDSDPNTAGDQALTVTTANGGYYRFDGLPAGDYIVEVLASNFTASMVLENLSSSTGANQEADPDTDGDLNDNGLDALVGGAVRSDIVTLATPEPASEVEPGSYSAGSTTGTASADLFSNLTLDFGFLPCEVTASVIAADQSICNGADPVAFTVTTAATGDATLSYQWQSSTTDCSTGFTDVSGATSDVYDPPVIATTTYYRVVVTNTNGSLTCGDTSNCLTITVNLLPTPADAPITICSSETSTDLTANDNTVLDGDVGTVSWYDGDPAAAGTLIAAPTTANLNSITDLFARVTATTGSCIADVDVTVTITTPPSAITFTQSAATCSGTTEQNDGSITLATATNGTHYGISTLGAAAYDGPTTIATATAIVGTPVIQSAAPNAGGTYIVRVFNTNDGCYADETVTVAEVSCACISPTATLIPVPGSCTGGNQNNDGYILLTAYSDASHYDVSVGATYTGAGFASATAVGTAPFNIQNNIANAGETYTLRLFNATDACFIDRTIVVPAATCPTDPMGYIYCEETGEIITGGSIAVSGPGTYTIVQDGSTGAYQFLTDGVAGVYTMTYTPPAGYTLSATRTVATGTGAGGSLDATGQADPFNVGSASTDGVVLDDFSDGANPFYLTFDLVAGDPIIQRNNIPLEGCFPTDWGDLPDLSASTATGDYQTSTANNGPSHVIVTGLHLGTNIDFEFDGQQSTSADGEGADDDALLFPAHMQIVPGGGINIPFSSTNTTGATAYLEMWIDWNGDGDFDDTNEMVTDLDDTSPFPTNLPVTIPTDAVTGQAIGVRIRLSNTDNMTPYGAVASGEVEDYLITLTCKVGRCLPVGVVLNQGTN